jgi:hypothetical protein
MNMNRASASVSSILGVAVCCSLLLAQQDESQRPIFRSDLDVVTLDVTVLDENRRPVRGLTAGDFRVAVDGEERSIVGFDAVEMPERIEARARWVQDISPDVTTNDFVAERVVVLLLDDWNTSPKAWGAVAVRKIGHAILDELGPSDLTGIVYPFSSSRGVERHRFDTGFDGYVSRAPAGKCDRLPI